MRLRRGQNPLVAVLLLSAMVVAAPIAVQAVSAPDQPLTSRTFIDLANKVRPAVVSVRINVETREMIEEWRREQMRPQLPEEEEGEQGRQPPEFEQLPDWLKEFFEVPEMPRGPRMPMPRRELFEHPYGAGSGMIFRPDGYIVTNRHVLYSPFTGKPMYKKGQITVVLHDKREFTGEDVEVVATDRLTDIAVLKVNASGLPALKWGDSDNLEIGEWVMAIGDPLELRGSVSQGIVSGLGREIEIANYPRLLQTTAVINPGNSGGPLVNLNGEIVGINMAIATTTRYWAGVGFAIPSSLAQPIAEDLAEHGHPVRRGHIGIAMLPESRFPALAAHEGYDKDYGVAVREVFPGFPAAEAGLEPYDIIVEIEGKKAQDIVTVQRLITAHRPGDEIEFKVFRDGEYKTLTVKAGEWPTEERLASLVGEETEAEEEAAEVAEEKVEAKGRIGLTVEDYPEDRAAAAEDEKAVVIRQIRPGSPAANAQPSLQAGDVILEVEKKRVHDVDTFADIVQDRLKAFQKSDRDEGTLLLRIRRNGATALVFVPLPKK